MDHSSNESVTNEARIQNIACVEKDRAFVTPKDVCKMLGQLGILDEKSVGLETN